MLEFLAARSSVNSIAVRNVSIMVIPGMFASIPIHAHKYCSIAERCKHGSNFPLEKK
jgi:hypothetical protein